MLSVPFVIAIMAAIFLTPGVRFVAARTGAMDRPDGQRKRQKYPVPTLGGVAVCVAILLAACVAALTEVPVGGLVPVLLSSLIICLVGAYDDVFNLKPRWKFVGQIIAVLPIVMAGDAVDRIWAFGTVWDLGMFGKMLTMLWLVSGINAINFLDGMDGLGSLTGVGLSIAAAAIALITDRTEIALLALIHAGALIGFMVYNLPPARVYLGDSGSMLIGMTVSYLAIQAPRAPGDALHLGVAVALLTVPILDTSLAILRRALIGQDVWHGDRRHMHHSLLGRGMSRWAVLRFLAGLFCVTGLTCFISVAIGVPALAWLAFCGVPAYLFAGHYCCRLEWELAKSWMRRVRVIKNRSSTAKNQ
ncbi:WecA-like glycosyltransferase [Symmachiella macrocystis]|uniref:WecA-like glycosyltransferase n=1 Tax=Symmachiella macrocystis TaxID=2527985 RepID=A0A5C6BQW5_9PLAN|nr:MraY family glycosyltransferase [Symmachiella macrocystis]TWU13606.1 WecA-like glycosyltransferase [Symmachiella macrocystis]